MVRAPELAGKIAVVTGASRGIGLAVAETLRRQGVDIVVCGRSEVALSKARAHLTSQPTDPGTTPGRVESVQANLRVSSESQRVVEHAIDCFGGVDILINNAGVGRFQALAEQSVDDWLDVIETNLNGVFYCCRAAIPVLRRRGGGWIINISSLAGSHPFAGGSAYCASKAGLNALSEALMQEVRFDKIRVSCVAPGSVDTGFDGTTKPDAGQWKLAPEDVAQVVLDLLRHDPRSLPSRVEIRPSRPKK